MLPGRHVVGLLWRHRLELDPERSELEPGDLGVDRLGDHVDHRLELGVMLGDVLGAQRLVREAHVHDRGRMSLGRTEVDQPALRDEMQFLATQVELGPEKTLQRLGTVRLHSATTIAQARGPPTAQSP